MASKTNVTANNAKLREGTNKNGTLLKSDVYGRNYQYAYSLICLSFAFLRALCGEELSVAC